MWASALSDTLSQGDLLTPTLVGSPVAPSIYVKRGPTRAAGVQPWVQQADWASDQHGLGHYVSQGQLISAIVLTHSCDIDNGGDTTPILIAPVLPLSNLAPEQAEICKSNSKFAYLYMGVPPGYSAEVYADLRSITFTKKKRIAAADRVASMSDAGTAELTMKLVAFLTRIPLAKIIQA